MANNARGAAASRPNPQGRTYVSITINASRFPGRSSRPKGTSFTLQRSTKEREKRKREREREREREFQESRIRVRATRYFTSPFSIAPLPKKFHSESRRIITCFLPIFQHILRPHLRAQYSQIDSRTLSLSLSLSLSRVPWKFTDFQTVEKSFEPPLRYPISHPPAHPPPELSSSQI